MANAIFYITHICMVILDAGKFTSDLHSGL